MAALQGGLVRPRLIPSICQRVSTLQPYCLAAAPLGISGQLCSLRGRRLHSRGPPGLDIRLRVSKLRPRVRACLSSWRSRQIRLSAAIHSETGWGAPARSRPMGQSPNPARRRRVNPRTAGPDGACLHAISQRTASCLCLRAIWRAGQVRGVRTRCRNGVAQSGLGLLISELPSRAPRSHRHSLCPP